MGASPLPTSASIGDLVTMLMGKKVRAVPCAPLPVMGARGIATYIDAAETLTFVTLTDIAFLAGMGAALAMIPPAVVTEAVKSGKPSAILLENAFEVMNIVASLYNDADGKGVHVKFHSLVVSPPLPPGILQRISKPTARLDLEVQLPGYSNGKLTLFAVT